MCSATARMRSGSATEVPPNFCTSRPTAVKGTGGAAATPYGIRARTLCAPCRAQTSDQRKKENAGLAARGKREAALEEAPAQPTLRNAGIRGRASFVIVDRR